MIPTPPAPGRAEALLPCPFCGGTDAVRRCDNNENDDNAGNDLAYAVVCDFNLGGCGAECGYTTNYGDAVAKWNRRPAPVWTAEALENVRRDAEAIAGKGKELSPAPAIVAEVGEVVRWRRDGDCFYECDTAGNFIYTETPVPGRVAPLLGRRMAFMDSRVRPVVYADDHDAALSAALRTLAEVRESLASESQGAEAERTRADVLAAALSAATQRAEQAERDLHEAIAEAAVRNDEVTGLAGMLQEATQRAEQAEAERDALLKVVNDRRENDPQFQLHFTMRQQLERALAEALKSHDDPSYLRDNGRQRAPNEWRALLAALPAPATNATGSSHEKEYGQ